LLKKKITVLTNDEMNPKIHLTIAGNVTKFVTIIPERISLVGIEGQELQMTAKIIPEEEYPFKILDILAVEKSNFSYQLKKINTSDKTEYEIEFKNLKKDKGYYNEEIELVTDSKIKPKITLNINGLIREKPKAD